MSQTQTQPGDGGAVSVRVVWPRTASSAAQVVNQVALADGANVDAATPEGSVYMMLGHAAPPILPTPDDLDAFLQEGGQIDVEVRAAVYMTRARALELYHSLGERLGLSHAPSGE